MIDAVNPRVELPAGLVETRAIVLLPGCTLDEAVAPVEVLIEEGLPILSLSPGQRLTPSMLRRVFGRRLLVGTHDLRTPADAQWAVSEQAAFALALGDDDQLRSELAAAQIPQCPAALTPTEIANAWKQPAAGRPAARHRSAGPRGRVGARGQGLAGCRSGGGVPGRQAHRGRPASRRSECVALSCSSDRRGHPNPQLAVRTALSESFLSRFP